jgi:hypothetical protein
MVAPEKNPKFDMNPRGSPNLGHYRLLAQQLEELFSLNSSKKHMVNRDMGRLEPTPSLKYKALA